jgi:hypothetical protein
MLMKLQKKKEVVVAIPSPIYLLNAITLCNCPPKSSACTSFRINLTGCFKINGNFININ